MKRILPSSRVVVSTNPHGFLWPPNSNNLMLLSDVSLYSFIILPYFVLLIDLYSYSVMIVFCFVYFIGIE